MKKSIAFQRIWRTAILAAAMLCVAGTVDVHADDDSFGYQGEISLYVMPYCPERPLAKDITVLPGTASRPLPKIRYCKHLEGGGLYASVDNTYLGQIRHLETTQCPKDYLDADGRLLRADDHPVLFNLFGTTFGGNKDPLNQTFALPNLPPPSPGSHYCVALKGVYPHTAASSHIYLYAGKIFMLPSRSCPYGTIEADGRVLNIVDNQALYALLGRMDFTLPGSVKFHIPDLRAYAPPGIKYCIVIQGPFPLRW